MSLAATVLIPTHDHGPTLLRSVPSALAQTVTELEVFVIGDGAPDVTRELMAELTAADERVRYFDRPKGPRNGEIYRDAVLREHARGEIVCYLADDDLWLPHHVAELQALLTEADFAHTLPLTFAGDGALSVLHGNLAAERSIERLLSGGNWIPLPNAGHTRALYERSGGWRTTPAGIPTDLYMWQQLVQLEGCRGVSGLRPTVLHFPSLDRPGWTTEERLQELDSWASMLGDPRLHTALDALAESELESRAWVELSLRVEELLQVREEREVELEQLRARLDEVSAELWALAGSVTWRLRERLLRLPGLGGALRAAARALAPRAGR
jgi:hypothetical protein